MKYIIFILSILILFFLLYTKKEKFNMPLFNTNFTVEDLPNTDLYQIITSNLQGQENLINTDLNGYKKYSLNFVKNIRIHSKFFLERFQYTEQEMNIMYNKIKIILIGDAINRILDNFSYYNSESDHFIPNLNITKNYLNVNNSTFRDDNTLILNNDQRLIFDLNSTIEDQFQNIEHRDVYINVLNNFRNELTFIKNNYGNTENLNKLQSIFFDPFSLNFGLIYVENYNVLNENMSIEFKIQIFNKSATISGENYRLNTRVLRNSVLEDTHFTDNKIFIASNLVNDQENIRNEINQIQSNSLGERYESILGVLSNSFTSSDELNNILLGKLNESESENVGPFFNYLNTRINFNNQLMVMLFRNLLVYELFLNDFRNYLIRNNLNSGNTREDFSNMCTDLKLPGNKTYTDNELFNGLSCSDYANFNLCSNNDVTPRYRDYNLNILNLNAKDACCVCGGGDRTSQGDLNLESDNSQESNYDDQNVSNENLQDLRNNMQDSSIETGLDVFKDFEGIAQYGTKGVGNIFYPTINIESQRN